MAPRSSPPDSEPSPDALGLQDTAEGGGRTDQGSDEALDVRVARASVRQRLFGQWAPDLLLGRYCILERIGAGGMGSVYAAYDPELDRRVAIKLLNAERESGEQQQRLVREAQAMARLSHPNVVAVHDVGMVDGRVFIAMELVQGQTLSQWQRGDRTWRECVEVYLQAGSGLAAAHAQGLVHRDFKPDNCIVDEQGRPRVLDFGLVRETTTTSQDPRSAEVDTLDGDGADSLTRTGAMVGTPAYMPLEQLNGRPADARSDQFSFCVSLYEALYGERPFSEQSLAERVDAMAAAEIRPPPKGSVVPSTLRQVVLRGLSTEPEERWPTMEALRAELRRVAAPRARRGLPALVVGAGLAALGVGLWEQRQVDVVVPCQGASQQLDGVWDDVRREEVRGALLGTGVPFAPDTWDRVEQRLDDYAAAWVHKHIEVCEATNLRREQSAERMDLRMGCLHRSRSALCSAVDALTRGGDTAVTTAVDLAADLPRLSRCDEVDALAAEVPPPEDPRVDVEVEALRERLVQSRALERVGLYDDALAVAEGVVEQADALGYPPLLGEALYRRGEARAKAAQLDPAEEDLGRAYALAVEHGHHALQVLAAARLVWVVGYEQARHDEGFWWSKIALPLAKNPRTEPSRSASVHSDIGSILSSQGKRAEALVHYRRALAVRERVLEPDDIDIAASLVNIGIVLAIEGEHADAMTHQRQALAIRERALGPEHPEVAASLHNIGNVLAAQSQFEEAQTHYERALAIRERALGPDHLRVADTLNNLGNVLQGRGEHAEALTKLQRALAIKQRGLGPEHPGLASTVNNIGISLRAEGQLDEAMEHFKRVVVLAEGAWGPEHPNLAHPLVGLAEVALEQHDFDAARTHAERAVLVLERGQGLPGVLPYHARFLLARALWPDPTQRPRALRLAKRARDAYSEFNPDRRDQLAEVEQWIREREADASTPERDEG